MRLPFEENENARRNTFWIWVIGGALVAIGMVATALTVARAFERRVPSPEPATLPVEPR